MPLYNIICDYFKKNPESFSDEWVDVSRYQIEITLGLICASKSYKGKMASYAKVLHDLKAKW